MLFSGVGGVIFWDRILRVELSLPISGRQASISIGML